MNKRKTSIVIITYNNLDYTKDCISSIKKYTKKGTYEIIVVDNLSTDGTRQWLKEQKNIKIILNNENMGFPKGCNQGIKKSNPNYDILLLNNDTIVTTNWLDNLNKCLYSSDKIGAVGAVCNHNENLQGVDFTYENFEIMQELAKANNISSKEKWEEKIFLIGFCILIKRHVLEDIGYLDEEYTPGYIDDNDLSLRIIKGGYKLMLCHDCFIHHYLGSAFRKDLNKFYPILSKNRDYFKNKWGFETFAFDDIKYASLKMLEAYKDDNFKVLEVQCGIGATSLKIKNDYSKFEIFGVDSNEKKVEIAKNIMQAYHSPIGFFPKSLEENFFDCIIIGDILEKVDDPESFLRKTRKHLKSGGLLIGEFSNASHFNLLKKILTDNCYYNNIEKNNSFTLTDIHKLCYENGYRDISVLHWYSDTSEEDNVFIQNMGNLVDEERLYLYRTYYYSFKFEK